MLRNTECVLSSYALEQLRQGKTEKLVSSFNYDSASRTHLPLEWRLRIFGRCKIQNSRHSVLFSAP